MYNCVIGSQNRQYVMTGDSPEKGTNSKNRIKIIANVLKRKGILNVRQILSQVPESAKGLVWNLGTQVQNMNAIMEDLASVCQNVLSRTIATHRLTPIHNLIKITCYTDKYKKILIHIVLLSESRRQKTTTTINSSLQMTLLMLKEKFCIWVYPSIL